MTYRNVEDAFPLSLSDSTAKLKANIEATSAVTAGLDASVSSSVTQTLYAISQRNESLMISFRALYTMFQGDPCGNSQRYADGVERLIEEQGRLNDVGIRLQALASLVGPSERSSETVTARLVDIIERLGSAPPELNAAITAMAIKDSRDTAQKWIMSGNVLDDSVAEEGVA